MKYNSRSLTNVMLLLEDWVTQSQDTLDNEESKDYPNDERIDSLTVRVDSLQAAVDVLNEIE